MSENLLSREEKIELARKKLANELTREDKIKLVKAKTAKSESLGGDDIFAQKLKAMGAPTAQLRSLIPGVSAQEGVNRIIDKGQEAGAFTGRQVDRFTGAPTRTAIFANIQGESPLKAFVESFGRDPDLAPTGKDIARAKGYSTEESFRIPLPGDDFTFSPAGAAGLAYDIGADWTNFIPGGLIAKRLAKGAGKTGVNLAVDAAEATAKVADKAFDTQKFTQTADTIKTGVKGTAKGLEDLLDVKLADDLDDTLRIAAQHDFPVEMLPDELLYGPESFIARKGKNIREGVLGGPDLKKFRQGAAMVRDKIDNVVETLGGGKPLDTVEAGKNLLKGYESGVENFFNKMDITYKTPAQIFAKQNGGLVLELSPQRFNNIQSYLGDQIAHYERVARNNINPNARIQAEMTSDILQRVRTGLGSYDEAVDTLRDVGQMGYTAGGKIPNTDIPFDKKPLRELYTRLATDIVGSVQDTLGGDVARQLKKNNEAITDFLKDKAIVSQIMESEKAVPEKVFEKMIKNGNSEGIRVLKQILPEQTFNEMRGAFIESLISRNPQNQFPLRPLLNALNKKEGAVKLLFSPEEIQQVRDLIKLGDGFGSAVLSTSGTGASMEFSNLGSAALRSTSDRAFVEGLKNRVAGDLAKAKTEANKLKGPTGEGGFIDPDIFKTFLGRGPVSSAGKAAQVFSVQKQEDNNALKRRLMQQR